MQISKKLFVHVLLGCACAFTLLGAAVLPASAQQTETSTSRGSNTSAGSDLPDSPGATLAKMEVQEQQQGEAPAASSPQSSSATNPPAQATPQRPVGTAAAEAPDTTGIAASQPAGAAIAPAKQRRVRTIVIKVGAIIGVGVAVGTVVALSEATGSKPPGAR
jgi:hypothetical protein